MDYTDSINKTIVGSCRNATLNNCPSFSAHLLLLLCFVFAPLATLRAALAWKGTSLDLFGDDVAVTVNPQGTFFASDGFDMKRSINKGTNWTVTTGFAAFAGGAFAVDSTRSEIMFAGRSHGLLKSVDGGDNWFELDDLNAGPPAHAIVVDPTNPETVFAGVGVGWGIYKSENGGGSWRNILSSTDVLALAINPVNTQILFAGAGNYSDLTGGVLKSLDGGSSWFTSLAGEAVTSIALDPTNPQVLYAGTENHGIFKTTDGGDIWVSLPQAANFAPVRAATKAGGVIHSADSGMTWLQENSGLTDLNCVAMAIQSSNPYTLLVATYAGKAYWTLPSIDPPAAIQSPSLDIALHAGLTITGTIGATYEIQYRDALDLNDNWKHLADVTLSSASQLFFDFQPANTERRFYRVQNK